MTAKCFVDSNVLVYARDTTEPRKQDRATSWIESLALAGAGRLSYQVLVEAYSALTHSRLSHMEPGVARTYIANFRHWRPVGNSLGLLEMAWRIQDRFGFSWWDCLIIAAARLAECDYLLTEDLQHGQDLDGLRVIDPFQVAPDMIFAAG
jgi:predicted nucleic acid-binding protein